MQLLVNERWRRSVYYFTAATAATFLINLVFTIWAGTRVKDVVGGVGVLPDHGGCQEIKSLNTALHILINALSAVMLAGSNYCMQCLSAPTREQVDAAHRRGRWLDIGVTSLRNLAQVGWKSLGLWLILCFSSIPLHLLYNSAIVVSTSASTMLPLTVNETILVSANVSVAAFLEGADYSYTHAKSAQELVDMYRNNSLTRLSNIDCINAYGTAFQSSWSDVLLVTNESLNRSRPLVPFPGSLRPSIGCGTWLPSQWVCGQKWDSNSQKCFTAPCELSADAARDLAANWRPFDVKVEYCLALPTTENCKLQVSLPICAIVTVINFLKAASMLLVAMATRQAPLLTVGDAVASFLQKRDETTAGMCLKSRREFSRGHKNWAPLSQQFCGVRRVRFVAVNVRRWLFLALLFSTAVAALSCVFVLGSEGVDGLGSAIMSGVAFGAPAGKTMINVVFSDVLSTAVIANSAQLILSVVYVVYNNILTSICLAAEYTDFASERKGLRVSARPVGAQRAAYFLQLPLKLGVPLVVISGTMHWLISQSLYLIKIDLLWSPAKIADPFSPSIDSSGRELSVDHEEAYLTLGWSPLGVVLVYCGVFVMITVLVGYGFFKFKKAMPVAGSCSAAISAACHRGNQDKAALKPWEREVQWGVSQDKHCSFSALPVEYPLEGETYM